MLRSDPSLIVNELKVPAKYRYYSYRHLKTSCGRSLTSIIIFFFQEDGFSLSLDDIQRKRLFRTYVIAVQKHDVYI